MEDEIQNMEEKILMRKEFNARTLDWVITAPRSHDIRVLEMTARIGLRS